MRRLMLLRHAKTESEAPSGRDQDRQLDERGRQDAADIGGWIGRHPPCPDIVLVSPAVRAQQTWSLASEALQTHAPQPQAETITELYGADPGQLLQIVRMAATTDPRQLLLVGHNPGMHELALALVDNNHADANARQALADNLPTSGLVVFDFAIDDWNDVGFRGGKLVLFLSPKLLKRASNE
jgi:phosphohistidine phosphatase